jgi:hypothetical protein
MSCRFVWLILGSVACTGSVQDSGTESDCGESTGELIGDILDIEGGLHVGSTVVYIYPEGEDRYSLPATSEGSYEVSLAPGHYRVGAESEWGCSTDIEPEVDVIACEEVRADLLMDLCFGR